MLKKFILWLAKTFSPEILKDQEKPSRIDRIKRDPLFDKVRLLIRQAEETKSEGQYKHIYTQTAILAEARRAGKHISRKDINFMIELALQLERDI